MKQQKRVALQYAGLMVFVCGLLFLPMRREYFFGSEGDWLSQHVGVAQSLRETMLQTGSILPQYIHLGGGSSIYDFAYYGLLRPDVLLSCLFPNVEMKYFIAGYAIFGVLLSVCVLFHWLRVYRLYPDKVAFWGAMLFACCACFYHAHHQIMFVNYMPFLLFALEGVERIIRKEKMGLLAVSLFLIDIHSFYYAPACMVVVGIFAVYCLQEWKMENGEDKSCWHLLWKGVVAVLLSVGMAMVLFLPVGMDILSTSKDGGCFADQSVPFIDTSIQGLLYSPYGCGMTLLVFYALMLSLTKKRKCFLAASLLAGMLLPVVSLLLNGFLYARAKILIPFTPLLVWVTVDTVWDLWKREQRHSLGGILLCLLLCGVSRWKLVIYVDMLILLLWLGLDYGRRGKFVRGKLWFGLLLLMPLGVSLCVSGNDSYPSPCLAGWKSSQSSRYIRADDTKQSHFSQEEIGKLATDYRYRTEVIVNGFSNCNLLANGSLRRTAMYSSVTNAEYARFFYEEMGNAIGTNNRVALVPGQNPCFNYFFGVRYLVAEKQKLPASYRIVKERAGYVLAENDAVLPVCYGVTKVVSRKAYDNLRFPYNMKLLCESTVVDEASQQMTEEGIALEKNKMQQWEPEDFFTGNGEERLRRIGVEGGSVDLPLKHVLQNEILILQLSIDRTGGEMVEIAVNNIRNKLSAVTAPYPNGNETFTYVLESGKRLDTLSVMAEKGTYRIADIRIYTMEQKVLRREDICLPRLEEGDSNVIDCSLDMNKEGYLVTSFPYRAGYHLFVDGQVAQICRVNTSFVGARLPAGSHRISLSYTAPGYKTGRTVSSVAWILFIGSFVYRKRKHFTNVKRI